MKIAFGFFAQALALVSIFLYSPSARYEIVDLT